MFTTAIILDGESLGWGDVAPFYVDREAPLPASGVPKPPVPPRVNLKDDHCIRITWFSSPDWRG